MALTKFVDSAGREAYKDSTGMVFTEGGTRSTGYNVNDWNKRQGNRYPTSGSSSGNSSLNGLDMQSIINNAIKMQQETIKPAVAQLESTIKPTTQSFDTRATQLSAERQPLKDRYKSLIDTIKGNQTTSENRQTVATRNELGKRGIPLTSGVAEQEVVNAVNPITSEYSGLIKETGLKGEADLRDLENQITNLGLSKVDALNVINNAIATMKSNAGSQGIQTGLGIYGTNLNQSNLDRQFELDRSKAASDKSQFDEFIKAYLTPDTNTSTTTETAAETAADTGSDTGTLDDLVYEGKAGFDTSNVLAKKTGGNSVDDFIYQLGLNKSNSVKPKASIGDFFSNLFKYSPNSSGFNTNISATSNGIFKR